MMNANAWIALAGLVFSAFVTGMVTLAFTFGKATERLTAAEKKITGLEEHQADILEAIESGDCGVKAKLAEALAAKAKAHAKLHERLDEAEQQVGVLRTDHERLKSRCETIHGAPSQVVHIQHDTYREDPHE